MRIPHFPRSHFEKGGPVKLENSTVMRFSCYINRVLGALRGLNLERGALVVLSDSGNPMMSSKCSSGTRRLLGNRDPTKPLQNGGCDTFRKKAHVPTVID